MLLKKQYYIEGLIEQSSLSATICFIMEFLKKMIIIHSVNTILSSYSADSITYFDTHNFEMCARTA